MQLADGTDCCMCKGSVKQYDVPSMQVQGDIANDRCSLATSMYNKLRAAAFVA